MVWKTKEEESFMENVYRNIVTEQDNGSDVDIVLNEHLGSDDSVTITVNGILADNMS